jgi:uncharacterized protein (DUF4415 family)
MKKSDAEPRRQIDFSRAKRGPVVKAMPGKTKISIRLDNEILDHFRSVVERTGGGNYQSLINDALRAHIVQASTAQATREAVKEELTSIRSTLRQVVREEVAAYRAGPPRKLSRS